MKDLKDLYFYGENCKKVIRYAEYPFKELKTKHYGMIKGHWNYALFEKNEIIYIGSSSHLAERLLTHKTYKTFDKVVVLEYKKRKTAFSQETYLINYFKPKHNIRSK